MSTPLPPDEPTEISQVDEEALASMQEVESRYSELLDHCAADRRDGEVLLEALHMIDEWSHDFTWVDLDEASDLRRALSKRLRLVSEGSGQGSRDRLLDSLADRGTKQ